MSPSQTILSAGTLFTALGIWLLLPGSATPRRTLGGVLAVVGFGCLGSQVPDVGDWFTMGVFHAVAAATIVAAVATISFRSPVYCAIWFGMTLTGTAGLFLLAGAEFLAVATLVVYAGAILVTFLFVLMLSQPEGHTSYDRRSWEPMISAFIGAVLVGLLTTMIGKAIAEAGPVQASHAGPAVTSSAPYAISRLGAELFTRYLVAVEAAGALLFAALVGAAVIVTQGRAAMKRPAGVSGTPGSGSREGGTAHAS
jgi:NADH-quinone oxidoreductase subunit J